MLSIVAHDDVIWGLYLRIIKRDTKQPQAASVKKDGARKSSTPMKSSNDLLPFLNLPPTTLQELLNNVVEGFINYKAAKELAEQYNAKTRLLRELELRFNSSYGIRNPSRAKKQGKWTSYSQIVKLVPDVQYNLDVWRVPFGKSKLNAIEAQNFNVFVDRIWQSYDEVKKGRRRASVQAVPKQFMVGMVKEQKQGEGAKRWAVVEALGELLMPPSLSTIERKTSSSTYAKKTRSSVRNQYLFSNFVSFVLICVLHFSKET